MYDWKRFWCPREGRIQLDDDGFLLDPDSKAAAYYDAGVVPFEKIAALPCLALLGEPGLGKSTAKDREIESVQKIVSQTGDYLISADLREYGTDSTLRQKIFESPKFWGWKHGSGNMHLFLDSLDECLLRVENVAAVLLSELRGLPVSRLRLRIVCRTADWFPTLELGLKELWGEQSVGVFELALLRRCDVVSAAIAEGVTDPDALLKQIDALGAGPFASRPVTLRFLLNLHLNGKPLPANRIQMYREGCKQLCETSQNRRDARRYGKLTASERLRVASRLAAITQCCNRNAIWTGHDQGGVPPEDVVLDTIVDGTEGEARDLMQWNIEAVRETIGETGLFSSRGAHRMGWTHQTYAEFLAADYLHEHKMAPERMLQLILHPDGSGKVVPQLRELAAWLAGMEPTVIRALAKADPEILLRSDVKSISDTDRAGLVANLLASYEAGELWEVGDHRALYRRLQSYGRLGNAHLAEILRPYIADSTRHPTARVAAVDIAQACNLQSLQTELANLALDPAQNYDLRTWAAMTVLIVGNDSAKSALKPLAVGPRQDDPNDELKGFALRSLWPDQLTADELFDCLTRRKRTHFFGSYHRFLDSDIVSSLRSPDLTRAVVWAGHNLGPHPEIDPETALSIKILVRALDHFEDDKVISAIAQTLAKGWDYGTTHPPITEKLQASQPARRRLAQTMLPLVATNNFGALMLLDLCAITWNDLPWLLDELQSEGDIDKQKLLCDVIPRLNNPQDVDTFDAVLVVVKTHPYLQEALRPFLNPVALGSQEAADMRTEYERFQRHQRTPESTPSIPDVTKIKEILAGGKPDRFSHICFVLEQHPANREQDQFEVLKGWSSLPTDLQSQVTVSAYDYLTDYRLPQSPQWWKERSFPYAVLSAYWAFALLRRDAPARFEQLSDQVWHEWAAAAICPFPGESRGEADAIAMAAYRRVPARLLQVFDDIIDGENERHGTIFVLPFLNALWDDRIQNLLVTKLASRTLKPGPLGQILTELLKRGDRDAHRFAVASVSSPESEAHVSITAAAQLVLHTPDAAWSLLWPLFRANGEWGKAVCLEAVHYREMSGEPLAAKLNDDQLADLFLLLLPLAGPWMPAEGGGMVEPSDSLSRWCDSLPRLLADRGSISACAALRRILDSRPDLEVLKWYLKSAEDLARRNTWIPCEPKEIIELARNPAARLVRTGEDLLSVVTESLTRLEALLHGETPAARFLWDESVSKPKDESAISDYIKQHLNFDLIKNGVIVNREVEIRPALGVAKGEETDIHVDVVVPTEQPGILKRISVIVEVKGCWNRDLNHAMETQLVDRYLSEGGFGLYFVAWFACPRWGDDYRREKTPKITIEEARHRFEAQATALSTQTLLVRAVVLDVTLA